MDTENKLPVEINMDVVKTTTWEKLQKASWEELVQMGQEAGEIKTYSQWVLGMLGRAVIRKYGDLKKYALETRQDYGTLRQYMHTYRKFTNEDADFHPNKYYGSVPWGVLALAATKSDKPQELVDELQKENKEVTLKSAYREIKRLESPAGNVPPPKPIVKLQWDKNSNLYKLIMNPKDYPSIDWTDVRSELKEWLDGLK